jgi:Flp pilus assembly protein TadD
LDKAIAEFEEAIKINPDDAKAHYNLGLTYDNQGRLDEAIAEYQEAIRLDPDYARAHNNLGLAYYNQGRPDEAIAEFEEAIKINPDDAKAHNNLGIAYAEQGRADEAIAEYQKAIRLDPDYARAHNNLGLAYMEEGRAEEAIVEFETYLQLAPDAPDRAAVEEDIAKLKESAEYRNAAGGYSLLYPEGWYYTEDEAQVIFAKSEEALEAAPEEAPMVMFIAGPLSKIAESLNLEEITDPVVALKAMGENLEAEMDEVETGKLAGYPSAVTSISGTFQGASYQGDLIVALVEERVVYGVALAPPEQWEAFRSTFIAMVNSLSFFEP